MSVPGTTGNLFSKGLHSLLEGTLPSLSSALRDSLGRLGSDPEEIALHLESLPERDRTPLTETVKDIGLLTERLQEAEEAAGAALRTHQWANLRIVQTTRPEGLHSPLRREPVPIDLSNILIATKKTKLQCDMEKWGLTNEEEAIARYDLGSEDTERIVSSHRRQLSGERMLREHFRADQFVSWENLSQEVVSKADLVVTYGGDNHFSYVTHFVSGDTPIIGVCSDPVGSEGALLSYTGEEFIEFLTRLEKGDYELSPWTRLKVTVDGETVPLATCDVFIGQKYRDLMSRHTLEVGDTYYEQKSSGMLVSTGAGSTGWFNSAVRALHPEGRIFGKTEPYGRFVLTEISATTGADGERTKRTLTVPPKTEGVVVPGSPLTIHSLNREGGVIVIDSHERIPFERGSTATIEIDESPLWVIGRG